MAPPAVTVVVATRNRSGLLERLLTALARQRFHGEMDVIVVDDASTDDTAAVLGRLASATTLKVDWLSLPDRRGPGGARNVGWPRSRAPLIAFTDDDCVPDDDWLASLVEALADADLVQGRTLPDPDQLPELGPFGRTIRVPRENGYFQTCNVGYRRDLLEQLSGFDESFAQVAEDTDLAWRAIEAGARTSFSEAALVHHDVRPSNWWLHVRSAWKWQGVVLAVRRHPGLRSRLHRRWFWKASHPPAICAAVGLALMVAPTTRFRRIASIALLLPYLRLRLHRAPLLPDPVQRVAVIPAALAADLNDVAVMAAGSVRYRRFLL